MPRPRPMQQEQGGCLRTSVLVTGILHIVLVINWVTMLVTMPYLPTVLPILLSVLGCIGGGFQIAGATAVCANEKKVKHAYSVLKYPFSVFNIEPRHLQWLEEAMSPARGHPHHDRGRLCNSWSHHSLGTLFAPA